MRPVSTRPEDPLTPSVQARIRTLFRHLPPAIAGEEEPVHQVRVSTRRLRVLLTLVAQNPGGGRVGRLLKGLRRLGRTAAASRDLDVCTALLETQAAAGEATAPPPAPFLRRLKAARSRARARMAEAFLDFDIADLRRDLRKVVGRGAVDPFTARLRLREFRQTEGNALIGGLETLGDRFDPAALHELRGTVRRLRYATEMGVSLLEIPTDAPAEFRRTQDVLGEVHDAWILAEWLARQASLAEARGRADEAARARRLEQAFRKLARARHRHFLAGRPMTTLRRAIGLIGSRTTVA